VGVHCYLPDLLLYDLPDPFVCQAPSPETFSITFFAGGAPEKASGAFSVEADGMAGMTARESVVRERESEEREREEGDSEEMEREADESVRDEVCSTSERRSLDSLLIKILQDIKRRYSRDHKYRRSRGMS